MIAPWMLYCVLCALGLGIAAVLAEQVLLPARRQVRPVWIAALALSTLVPVVAYRFAPRVAAAPPPAAAPSLVPADSLLDLLTTPAANEAVSSARAHASSWRAALAASDRPLTVAWVTLSAALIAHFVCGVIALTWMRRWWRRDTVLGVDVLVSDATGPALVGAMSPAIVVPEWTLAMASHQIELMLRHEQEHRRARDGQLLTVAQLAVIAMPWNVALWWQLMRLRVAVELDCDARVLRSADARSYGDLLLEVARPRRRLALFGATAFAERASQLERRIRAIGTRRRHASRWANASVTAIGLAAVSVAWIAPRPAVPAAFASHTLPSPTPAPAATREPAPRASTDSASAPVAATRPRDALAMSPRKPDSLARTQTARDRTAAADTGKRKVTVPGEVTRRPLGQGAALPDSIFENLFAGITLTPDQEAKARALINQLQQEQLAQVAGMVKALTSAMPLRLAIQARADSALLSLLTNDTDRATLQSRLGPQGPGARGRSGGAGFVGDTTIVGGGRGGRVGGPPMGGARVGGGGVGTVGGGRGGGRGGSLADVSDALFQRLFTGIALSPQQESDARAIVSNMMSDLRATTPPPPPTIFIVRPYQNTVVMSAESEAAFEALLTNDADRATLRSRITVEIRLTTAPPQR